MRGSRRIGLTAIGLVILGLVSCATRVEEPEESLAPSYEGRVISEVMVRYVGKGRVHGSRLLRRMKTRSGSRFSVENLDADIKSLYESGLVDEVKFMVKPDGRKVRVTAEVTVPYFGGPGVFIAGNTVFSDKRLAFESKLRDADMLDEESLDEASRLIERYYRQHGYRQATVMPRIRRGPGGIDDMRLVVEEGEKTPWRDRLPVKDRARR